MYPLSEGPGPRAVAELLAENERLRSNTEIIERERRALRAVVEDMLSGLAYLRATDRVPYGFAIDRLEEIGRAALRRG